MQYNLDFGTLVRCLKEIISDKKGEDIILCSNKDYTFIICTAYSLRHIRAISFACIRYAKENNIKISGHNISSSDTDWICLLVGGVVVHIMLQQTRDYFNLENTMENII